MHISSAKKRILAMLCILPSTLLAGTHGTQRVTLTTNAGEITFLAASANGRYLAAASLNSHVFVWETSDWKQIASVAPEPPPKAAPGEHQEEYSPIHGLAFGPDNQTVAFASAGILYTYDIHSKVKRARGATEAEALAFTPDGNRLMASTGTGPVEIWLTRTWQRRTAPSPVKDPDAFEGAISVSPDAAYAALSGDGGVGILELDHLQLKMLPLPPGVPNSVSGGNQVGISTDNRFVASGVSSFENNSIVVWDVASKTVVFHARTEDAVWAVAFSLDGSLLFAGAEGKIVGWKTGAWKQVCSFNSAGTYQFAVGPDWLAAGGGRQEITIIPLQECSSDQKK